MVTSAFVLLQRREQLYDVTYSKYKIASPPAL